MGSNTPGGTLLIGVIFLKCIVRIPLCNDKDGHLHTLDELSSPTPMLHITLKFEWLKTLYFRFTLFSLFVPYFVLTSV